MHDHEQVAGHEHGHEHEHGQDPRGVLAEFGMTLPDESEIRVWDSTAEVRYLVIPQRPVGTEHLDENALAALVNRDSMIGVAPAGTPT